MRLPALGICGLFFLGLSVVPSFRAYPNGGEGEYREKAHFLAKLPSFVEWPAGAFPRSDAPLLICAYGQYPFGPSLAEAVRGESVHGHPLQVRWVQKEKDLPPCHILYISQSEEKNYGRILESVGGASVLTVGESASFLELGGAVYFFPGESGMHFELNLGSTDRARLKLSSYLIALAQKIHHKPLRVGL